MVMTRRGVFHNLENSKYATSNGEVAFFFSSKFYLDKFMGEYESERVIFRKRISRAMVLDGMNTDLLSDIHLYKSIEKRGFRAFLFVEVAKIVEFGNEDIKGGVIKWQELHQFALVRMTRKNTLDWCVMQGQKLDELLKTITSI